MCKTKMSYGYQHTPKMHVSISSYCSNITKTCSNVYNILLVIIITIIIVVTIIIICLIITINFTMSLCLRNT